MSNSTPAQLAWYHRRATTAWGAAVRRNLFVTPVFVAVTGKAFAGIDFIDENGGGPGVRLKK